MTNAMLKLVAALFFGLLLVSRSTACASETPDAGIKSDETCLEDLHKACEQGLDAVRRAIAKSGVSILIKVLNYENHTDSSTIHHDLRPAQLKEERWICVAFDAKGSNHYSQQCHPGKHKGTIECKIQDGSDRFTLLFRREHGATRLVSINGTIEN